MKVTKYKSFDTREEAERALASSPYAYIGKNAKEKTEDMPEPVPTTLPASSLTIVWQSMLRAVAIPVRWSIGEYTWQAARKFFISAR